MFTKKERQIFHYQKNPKLPTAVTQRLESQISHK